MRDRVGGAPPPPSPLPVPPSSCQTLKLKVTKFKVLLLAKATALGVKGQAPRIAQMWHQAAFSLLIRKAGGTEKQ